MDKFIPLKDRFGSWIPQTILVAGLSLAAYLVVPPLLQPADSPAPQQNETVSANLPVEPSVPCVAISGTTATTRPIESIRVGDRVLAHNPQVSQSERATWQEPDWSRCFQVSLKMPLGDPDQMDDDPPILEIELIRPESWLRDHLGFLAEPKSESSDVASSKNEETTAFAQAEPALLPYAPLKDIYREILFSAAAAHAEGFDIVGLTVEMDLPEMGAFGTAIVTDIHPAAPVQSGPGQVVTATFSHPPTTQVLDVWFSDDSAPIGVTDNHLFWSEDRQQFLPIGEMQLGERVQTFGGQTKRLTRRLARSDPTLVYNLEVHGDHTYYAGNLGVLVHNEYGLDGIAPKEGMARLHASTRHVAIEVDFDGTVSATHRIKLNDSEAYIEDATAWIYGKGRKIGDPVYLRLPDGAAARAKQLELFELNNAGIWVMGQNSCVTHCIDVLQAGSVVGAGRLPKTLAGGFWDAVRRMEVDGS